MDTKYGHMEENILVKIKIIWCMVLVHAIGQMAEFIMDNGNIIINMGLWILLVNLLCKYLLYVYY